jgi:hypothetical protein
MHCTKRPLSRRGEAGYGPRDSGPVREEIMRFLPIAVIAAVLFASLSVTTSTPAGAQNERARTRITIKPRSYLDAGTTVKPGTARYHNYAFPPNWHYPSYGAELTGTTRYPLPERFWLPGY